ncbi:lauroyl-Kdo(2)-lipid IV(A) myristoyltransferase [Photobacterium nomapromontoriensis]|uniref:lauroyl-Kdo(2)-lipid IV(A) myristoyltransferase n=1 Tax=Photobacterium nomapromontoriensis TaxID=2910237 RepID=UPI003D147266
MSDTTYSQYNPTFQSTFLHPRHWLTWIVMPLIFLLALLPHQFRLAISRLAAKVILTRKRGAKRRALKNIELCFPDLNNTQRQELLERTFTIAGCVLLGFAQPFIKGRRYVIDSHDIKGKQHLETLQAQGKNIIMLVPHNWAIDFSALYFAANDMPMVAMIKPQSNPIVDWLMNVQRKQFGGRIYQRNQGIKPYLRSIKEGYLAYYLPDEEHHIQQSVFAPFFGHDKSTVKGVGKLAKLSNAAILPVFPSYNIENGRFEIDIRAPLKNFPSGDEYSDACHINQMLETMIREQPEQYMWILKILRTHPDGSRRY